MSIKIDLLPGYVNLRRWFKRLLAISTALLGSVGAILFVLYARDKAQLEKVQAEYEGLAQNEQIAIKAVADTKKATDAAAPIENVVKFFVDAGETGVKRAALLDLINKYIYRGADTGAVVSSIDLTSADGVTMKLSATVETPEAYENFLLNLRRGSATYPYPNGTLFAPDSKSNAVLPTTNLPGFPATEPVFVAPDFQPQLRPFPLKVDITATLKEKITVPSEPGTAAAASADGATPGTPPSGGPPIGGPPIGGPPISTPAT